MTVDQAWFESLIRREETDRRFVKCLGMMEESATKTGENFTSQITRITLTVTLGSGRQSQMTYIAKKIPEGMSQYFRDFGSFNREILVYKVLNKIEELMKAQGDVRETLWCQLKGYSDSTIVFEDLGVRGYSVINKLDMADEEHSFYAISELARFHAMGAAVIQQGIPQIEGLKSSYLLEKKSRKMFFEAPLKALRTAIKDSWGPEWANAVNLVDHLVVNLDEITAKLVEANLTTLNVINHGDFWIGNLLFKKDFRGKILGMKLVDFQITSVMSFAYDLCVFLYSAVRYDLRRHLFDGLLRMYQKDLTDNMNYYNVKPSKVPTLDQVKQVMDNLRVLAFVIMTNFWPFAANDGEVLFTNAYEEGKVMFSPTMFSSEKSRRVLGHDLRELMEMELR